jgi:hypothetical protein
MNRTRFANLLALLALAASVLGAHRAHAAFMVETRTGGKAVGNLSFGPTTAAVSTSTATSAAVGTTPGLGSIFGGSATAPNTDVYIYSYTPGTDVDNTTYSTGQILGSTTGFPGNGNIATGLTGGSSGIYNVYFTSPPSANVTVSNTAFTVTQNGLSIVLNNVDLNNTDPTTTPPHPGTGPDTDPGTAFVGGANNAWFKLGTVFLNAGSAYTVTQAANDSSFVSQRASAVMWEFVAVPEPSTLALAGMSLIGLGAGARRRKS